MTWKDKLELGLENDAGLRKDNLTPDEIRGPELPSGPGRSPVIPAAAGDTTEMGQASDAPEANEPAPSNEGAGPPPSKDEKQP